MNPAEQSMLLHQQWLEHPITKQLVKILRGRKDFYVDSIALNAGKGDVDELRTFASQINNTNWITNIVVDSELFCKQLTK